MMDAIRAYWKLKAIHTDGWEVMERCDRHFDGGEWSGPAWGRNWEEAEEHCLETVSKAFGISEERLSNAILCANHAEVAFMQGEGQLGQYFLEGIQL